MLIDSHCHIPHRRYEKSPSEIVQEAKDSGVEKLIIVGTSLQDNQKVMETAETFKNVFCSLAIYPHDELDLSLKQIGLELRAQLLGSKKIVAIGEIGIDISEWSGGRSLEEQTKLFDLQMAIASEQKLPVIIHNRNGDERVIEMAKTYSKNNVIGVAHCFSQDWEYAQKLLDLGYYISFSGMVTYPSRGDLDEIIKKVPSDRYLVETDAPYLPPQGHRGEVNYPKYVKIVAEKIAQVRGETSEKVSESSYSNTCALFGLK